MALAALDTAEYDLLITDCHMPEIDGLELARLIRAAEASPGTSHIPILGLTADVSAEMRARCLAAGMSDVAVKPIDLRRLRTAVAGLAAPRGAQPAVADSRVTGAVFDPAAYHEPFADDAVEGREWLTFYLESATQLVMAIERSAGMGDRDELAASAHKLASASLAAGAICLGRLGRRLEVAAADAPPPQLSEMAAAVIAAWRDARQAITGFISNQEEIA